MMRKSWSVWCDVTGCQAKTGIWRTRRGARDEAIKLGWVIYIDNRKRQRMMCPTHARPSSCATL